MKKNGDDCTYIISYKALSYLLILLGIPAGKKAHIVDIPRIFFKNKLLLKYVVSGIYDTDGHASGSSIELTTKSKSLKESLLNALLVFDIYPIIKEKKVKYKNRYIIYQKLYTCDLINNKKFYDNIGFRLSRKQKALKEIIDKKSNPNIDLIPEISSLIKNTGKDIKLKYNRSHNYRIYESYIYKFRNPSREGLNNIVEYFNKTKKLDNKNLLQLLANSDIFWDEIKSINYSRRAFVYDATVPGTKNFIGNGIILHNTAASLSVALSYALQNKLTVFFITPKHTQHRIAIETLRLIKQKYNLDFGVVDLIGKKWMCAQNGVTDLSTGEFYDYCKDAVEKKNL
ncbi:hypothetical protein HYU23_04445 [Candidatus Woesearchaeota archaeon]|nr:hypothetical protein [Candidatus Woesearchaeota archaeon]